MPKALSTFENAYIYVIGEDAGPFKIGYTTQPHNRLAALRIETKRDLAWRGHELVPFRFARGIEMLAHKLLSEHKSDGEWFFVDLETACSAVERAAAECQQAERPLRPKRPGVKMATEVDEDVARLIDDWRAAQPKIPSRSDAIRQLLILGLESSKPSPAEG